MKLTVDRITQGIAVLEKEDLSHLEVPVSLLPAGTKEGSILDFDGTVYTLNCDEESARRQKLLEKQNLLFKRTKKD